MPPTHLHNVAHYGEHSSSMISYVLQRELFALISCHLLFPSNLLPRQVQVNEREMNTDSTLCKNPAVEHLN